MRVMTIGLTAVAAVTVTLPLLPAFTPRAALASGVVGTGTAASCTEVALNTALTFGGTVTFNCGGAATITVTSTKTISADTTIDGGSLITISGGNSVGVFSVIEPCRSNRNRRGRSGPTGEAFQGSILSFTSATLNNTGVKFTVQNLTIANGNSTAVHGGGGIASYFGTLTVTKSTFSGSNASAGADSGGGGINSHGGTLTVTNCIFSGNSAGGGGAIYNVGSYNNYGNFIYGTVTVTTLERPAGQINVAKADHSRASMTVS